MKKAILSLLVLTNLALWGQTTLNVSTGAQQSGLTSSAPERTFEKLSDGFRISYKFKEANIIPDRFDSNADIVQFVDFDCLFESSKPALPIRYEDFEIPEDKR